MERERGLVCREGASLNDNDALAVRVIALKNFVLRLDYSIGAVGGLCRGRNFYVIRFLCRWLVKCTICISMNHFIINMDNSQLSNNCDCIIAFF